MRKRSQIKPYLFFCLIILIFLSIPLSLSVGIKGAVLDLISPIWSVTSTKKSNSDVIKLEKLQNESRELALENRTLKAILKEKALNSDLKEPISARVLYRSPLFWSHFLIIDQGSYGNSVISKGSPVVSSGSLIGVVDYVGKKIARVKLISDESLQPAVRVVRGKPNDDHLHSLVARLIVGLENKGESDLIKELHNFEKRLQKDSDPLFLAKGLLQGKSGPLWRSMNQELKGIGFNYDFSDDHGPARDLITGKGEDKTPIALIEKGDLLITSGLDGVFPEGIPVAYVKSVEHLKEGDFCFNIKALPSADSLGELTDVFVLPSLSTSEENFVMIR